MINKTDWRVFNIIFQLQKKENQDLENEHLLEKYQENNVDIAESITNILKFVGNLRKIIESSKVQDRRSIFGILLSNSVILDKKCLFFLAKPFCEICRNQEKVIGWSVRIRTIIKRTKISCPTIRRRSKDMPIISCFNIFSIIK